MRTFFATLCLLAFSLLICNLANGQTVGIITTIVGNGVAGFSGDGGPATSAELYFSCGVATDAAGNLYIADYNNSRIRKVNAGTQIITTIAGHDTLGFSGDGGLATAAELNYPMGVTVDTSGNVYFADYANHRIRKINFGSGIITTIAGNGTGGYSGDGAAATLAELYYPSGVALDATGNVYIADLRNNRIRKIIAGTGIITTIAGNDTAGYGGDGGPAVAAKLFYPNGIAIDAAGNVYIADQVNQRVRKINISSGIITTIAGNGIAGYSGDGGQATLAELNTPLGVAIDAAGNIYITDAYNGSVRKVDSVGIITTIAGNGTQGYNGDEGPATAAELNYPNGVTVDALGNVYVADFLNSVIRKVIGGAATGISQYIKESGIKLYPNPAKEMLKFECSMVNCGNTKLEISNLLGEVVLSKENVNPSESLDVSALSSGIYFVKVNNAVQKVVKE